MRECLRGSIGENGWEQQILFGKNASPIPEIAALEHGHISVNQIKAVITTDQWDSYFKFAIVRNPFDRFVSICAFLNRQSSTFSDNPLLWMKAAMNKPQFKQRLLVKPQVTQLMDQHGKLELDYIGRYEELQDSVDFITGKLDIQQKALTVKNASKHRAYQEYYDESLYQSVLDFYKDDLSAFNYSF